jgi:hypothetical protein
VNQAISKETLVNLQNHKGDYRELINQMADAVEQTALAKDVNFSFSVPMKSELRKKMHPMEYDDLARLSSSCRLVPSYEDDSMLAEVPAANPAKTTGTNH